MLKKKNTVGDPQAPASKKRYKELSSIYYDLALLQC